MLEVQCISESGGYKKPTGPSCVPALRAITSYFCHLEHSLPPPSPEGTILAFLHLILVQQHLLLLDNPK